MTDEVTLVTQSRAQRILCPFFTIYIDVKTTFPYNFIKQIILLKGSKQ